MLMSITIGVICHVVSHMRQTTLRDLHREDICRRPKVPLDAHPAMPLVTYGARGVSTDGDKTSRVTYSPRAGHRRSYWYQPSTSRTALTLPLALKRVNIPR
jgi:hypothetical protein